ncbi:MAG: WYL domain-containing protein [Oscillospiraceae bacterium]|nr:WYL domain-containing protein [Oscillospiraceae bacterium]
MAKFERQKLKLLYLLDYLSKASDEHHPVTVAQIIAYLAAQGIPAERKSIYADVEALIDYGLDIVQLRGRGGGYFLTNRKFELPELKLLADSVQSSRFITEKKSLSLIRKIESLTSDHEAKSLQHQVVVMGRVKTMNESIYYNVDKLNHAIAADRQITFQYFEYAPDKSQILRRGGARYRVSPFALCWADQNYYLICYETAAQQRKHFRVDKMLRITVTDTPRDGHEVFSKIDLGQYEQQLFDMFSGTATIVRMRFLNRLAGAVIDRFGKDINLIPADDAHFSVSVPVVVSPRFFGWLAGFGADAELLAPAQVRAQMRDEIEAIAALYR